MGTIFLEGIVSRLLHMLRVKMVMLLMLVTLDHYALMSLIIDQLQLIRWGMICLREQIFR